ncbi:HAMP domain-containing sensor histidine kinase [Pantoea sp. BAV 3049]|uniref:HAMP domain-containing sensor histidine kinase n=1 Tax=Pantoea sp. BAV 3049 TaxID=2654188 RepID=UPI00131C548A|nr:HAMP domain-containing sensor histidine kinase [Pantoea sp. BAV 3049]
MRKLTDTPMYQQIFFAVTAAISIVVISTIAIWLWVDDDHRHLKAFAAFTSMMEETLPPADSSRAVQSAAIDSWMQRTHTRFTLFDGQGHLLSRQLSPPTPYPRNIIKGGFFDDGFATRFVWQLADKRLLVVQFSDDRASRPWLFIGLLMSLACAVALAAWPVIRRLTARLETLQLSVESLGKGDLSSRVPVSGDDEVGRLAASFNRSASQLETLVSAQKNMLARASHELRSPLARIQMASALLATEASPVRHELERSVAELDELVEEILTMSRLETAQAANNRHFQPADITAIAAEECARAQIELEADHVIAQVDATLIRRLMRNLLENALKHGALPVTASLRLASDAEFIFEVCDRGPGIPADEAARIFEPFYRMTNRDPLPAGSGLGLALVRAVAEHHAGQVFVHNRQHGGARFSVQIPVEPVG